MVLIRLAKVAMIGSLAAYAFIVAYDNVVDYQSNYEFVRHVLSMDTTFPGNTLMHRAISNEYIWGLAYALIIAIEGLTAPLLMVGALVLLSRLRAPAEVFNRSKVWAVAGLTVRLWPLVFRLHGDCRRILRHVAVEDLERAGRGGPHLNSDPWSADFRQLAGRRKRLADESSEPHRRIRDCLRGRYACECGRSLCRTRSNSRVIRLSSNEGSMVSTSSCTGGILMNSSEIRICGDD